MAQLFTNNATSLLANPISDTATSLNVIPGHGSLFPSPSNGDYFLVTLEDQSATYREIIKVTGRSGDTLSFDLSGRGQEGTSIRNWAATAGQVTLVDLRITAEALTRFANSAPALTGEPNGFINASEVSLSWDNPSRTLTISPVGASYSFYSNGIKFTKTGTENITIANILGAKYVYFNASGVLSVINSFDIQLIKIFAWVTTLYWNVALATAVPDALMELHGCDMSAETHAYLHTTHGTAFQSGLLPIINATGDGSLLSHVQMPCAAGVIRDEDIVHAIPARLGTDIIPVCYRVGVNEWRVDSTSSAAVRTTGSGRAAYNQFTGGAWQLTEVPNGDYVLAHLYAIPGLTQKYTVIMGLATYTTIQRARAAARTEIMAIDDFPLLEAKLIATLLVQTNNTYNNAVKSRFVETDAPSAESFVDWRHVSTVAGVPSSTPPIIP